VEPSLQLAPPAPGNRRQSTDVQALNQSKQPLATSQLGLSEREFEIIKTEVPEGSGMFLFKQGHHSVVLKLPLDGMDDDLAVLSARSSNLALMDKLIAQHGENVGDWLPHFIDERRTA